MATPPKPKRNRFRRRLLIASGVVIGSVAAVYVAAELDMVRERKARSAPDELQLSSVLRDGRVDAAQ